jgi:hypothetical protein
MVPPFGSGASSANRWSEANSGRIDKYEIRPHQAPADQAITGSRDRADGGMGWSGVAERQFLARVRVARVRRRAHASRVTAAAGRKRQ